MKVITKERLICIANVETNEVLRISQSEALEIVRKKDSNWFITDKTQYKLYRDGFNPTFTYTNKEGRIHLKNVFLGYPSVRNIVRGSKAKRKNNKYKKKEIKRHKGTSPTDKYIGKKLSKPIVSKSQAIELAKADGITLSFNGKKKICYFSGTMNINTIQAYKQLLPEYRFVNNCK